MEAAAEAILPPSSAQPRAAAILNLMGIEAGSRGGGEGGKEQRQAEERGRATRCSQVQDRDPFFNADLAVRLSGKVPKSTSEHTQSCQRTSVGAGEEQVLCFPRKHALFTYFQG